MTLNITWFVIEFENAACAKWSVKYDGSSTVNITINSVNTANSVVFINYHHINYSTDVWNYLTSGRLTSSTNLRLQRQQSSSTMYPVVSWFVVDFS